MSTITLDPALTSHPVPAIRGAMTEWMFSDAAEAAGRTTDPRGCRADYGTLLPLQEEDYRLAAETGLTTIRMAIEHKGLEDDTRPGAYKQSGFRRIEQVLDWCGKYGLCVILDLHNALGREFGGDPRLWHDVFFQNRFVAVWEELVRRLRGRPEIIAWEPLNEAEPPDSHHEVWNDLAKRVTDVIRRFDPRRQIIVDSIGYAHPSKFDSLRPTGDPNTAYSFHWYAPTAFHMQKRPWVKDKESYHYPDWYDGRWWNHWTIREEWERPLRFAARHGVPLFCGEFGCVSDCPQMEDMLWLLDVVSLLDRHDIGWTYYHYMFRTPEPHWGSHFDCNLFVRDAESGRLRRFARKVYLLSDLMKLRGSVLRHDDPEDPQLMVYAVRKPAGALRIYVSNKSNHQAKTATVQVMGGPWAPNVAMRRMGVGSDAYLPAPPLAIVRGRIVVDLEPLSIARLTVETAGNVGAAARPCATGS